MNIENNHCHNSLSEKDLLRFKKDVEDYFQEHDDCGIYHDILNSTTCIFSDKPLLHYYEYFLHKYSKEFADFVIAQSSPEKIAEFDKLVDEYNLHSKQMNAQTKQDYVRKFKNLALGNDK